MNEKKIDDVLEKLSHSKFRSSFHLKQRERTYIQEKGFDTIQSHAYDFINKRLVPMHPFHDGKQTPMKGHPVFIAQHATATCCRGCLAKWHHILDDHDLTTEEIQYIVQVIMTWIIRDYSGD